MIALESGKRKYPRDHFRSDIQKLPIEVYIEVRELLEAGKLSQFSSDSVHKFEILFSQYLSTSNCCCVSNGTMALYAAFKSLGIKPGDKIIIPGYSYAATLMAVLSCFAEPLFIDIDASTFCIDIQSIPEAAWRLAKAIVPVHLFGCPCDMGLLSEFARNYNVHIIEDCAQSTGAEWGNRKVGTFGIGCHSFMQNKILRMGEGGAVTVDDSNIANKVRRIRHEGEIWKRSGNSTTEYLDIVPKDLVDGIEYPEIGLNLRLSPLHALIGQYSLKLIDDEIEKRERNAQTLIEELKEIPELNVQKCPHFGKRVWMSFVCTVKSDMFDRNMLLAALLAEGVPAGVHFPYPLYKLKIIKHKYDELKNVDYFCGSHIAFPIYSSLTKENMHEVGETIRKVVSELRKEGPKYKAAAEKLIKSDSIKSFFSGAYFLT